MNCQEFRKKWSELIDDDLSLSHMEHCDICLQWIEGNVVNDEQGLFMKYFPQPSTDLEERIMQNIYVTASVPPSAPPLAVTTTNKQIKKLKLPIYTSWVSAAAVLLVLGVLSVQMLHSPRSKTDTAQDVGKKEVSPVTNERVMTNNTADGSDTNQSANIQNSLSQANIALSQPKSSQNTAEQRASQPTGTPTQEQQMTALAKEPTAESQTGGQPDETMKSRSDTMIAMNDAFSSRASESAVEPSAQKQEQMVSAPTMSMSAASSTLPNPLETEALTEALGINETSDSEEQRTIASFTDIKQAVQASSLPIPDISHLSQEYVLKTLSIRYESETASDVIGITSSYQRGSEGIMIEVSRNDTGKRSLSIPGKFTNRQLYSIDGQQAIAVTFDTNAKQMPYPHVVHFTTTTEASIPLYVVMKAKGLDLAALVEVSKQIAWLK